jgi:ribosome-associated heat shock protein Hsp15
VRGWSMETTAVRIDKWLWGVRLFKTRTAAIEACRAGHVKVGGESVKPARELRLGEVVTVQVGEVKRTLKVVGFVERRVAAKALPAYMEDLTPPEERERRRNPGPVAKPVWEKGRGRPTKRDRRLLDRFLDLPVDPGDWE